MHKLSSGEIASLIAVGIAIAMIVGVKLTAPAGKGFEPPASSFHAVIRF
jgi:hypothetical protein